MAALVRAAKAEESPALAMVWSGLAEVIDLEALAPGIVTLGRRAPVPTAVHLDHARNSSTIRLALDAGFTSVMVDGSALPLEENVRFAREAKRLAYAANASVEGVVGEIGEEHNAGDGTEVLTDPKAAATFWERTRVDALAVAVGTRHGRHESPPQLDLVRLRAIAQCVPVPLVLHGGSYVPEDEVRAAIASGVAKVNIATELEDAFVEAVARLDLSDTRYASEILSAGYEGMEERIRLKMRLFGSSGRA